MSPTPPIHVIKIGGHQMDDNAFLARFVAAVRDIQSRGIQPIIVHGGGQEIDRLHRDLQVPSFTVQGLRVTTEQSLRLVKMALNGLANSRLVRWLVNGGVAAIGLSGVDLGLIRVEKYEPDGINLGRVGRVVEVQADRLMPLLAAGFVPVISPISLGRDGLSYNVNADHAAEAVALALQAAGLVFITNVPGVLIAGQPLRVLPVDQVEELIGAGFITGGMIPKVRAAAAAVNRGLAAAIITDIERYALGEGTFLVARMDA
jgi:acetylglutamate kinase